MSEGNISVNMVVIYTIDGGINKYIHMDNQGNLSFKASLQGAQMFKPLQAEKFIRISQKQTGVKYYVQAVK